jgi:PAS domain S-box-containing protein
MTGLVDFLGRMDSRLVAPRGDLSLVGGTSLFFGLFDNLAVLIILIAIYGVLVDRLDARRTIRRQAVLGLVFGIFVYICMHVRIPVATGVIVDQRNAMVILAGFFGGPLSAVISAAVGASYRAYLGGIGVYGGILGLGLSAIGGSVLRSLRPGIETPGKLALSAIAVTVFILPGFLPVGDLHAGWMLVKAVALPYGAAASVGIFVASLVMLNEERRREAARALRESESRYRGLFQNMMDVHFRADRTGSLSIVSPASEQVTGYRPDEMVGRHFADFSTDHTRYAALLDELERHGSVKNFELDLARKNGTTATVWTNAQWIIDPRGKPVGIDGVLRDVTQAKKDAEEKKALEESLRQRNKMQAIGQFAGGIAHDFNNMLSVIIGFAELAMDDLPRESRAAESVMQVITAGERARRLVAQILTFSRGGAVAMTPTRLDVVLREALEFLKMTVPSSVAISAELSEGSAVVRADATQINEAVMNLASNAVHAMASKGVLSVRLSPEIVTQARRGRIGEINPGEYSVIEIQDTGVGMDSAVVEKAFEPFFTTKPRGEGTGMGLSVVYGIMREHGGDIVVDSTPGKGTSVRLYFPRTSAKPAREAGPRRVAPGRTERILVVDDESIVAEFMNKSLASLGYRVTVLTDPSRALELLRADPGAFELLITDQTMPQMTGIELAKQALALNHALPVILCTGYSSPVDQELALAEGISRICIKPASRGEMSQLIREVLDAKA